MQWSARIKALLAIVSILNCQQYTYAAQSSVAAVVEPKLDGVPVAKVSLNPKIVILKDGTKAEFSAIVTTAVDSDQQHNAEIASVLDQEIGVQQNREPPYPVEKLVVTTSKASDLTTQQLQREVAGIGGRSTLDEINTLKLPYSAFRDWFDQNHNGVYSLIRFFLNGVGVGATLIHSAHVPLFNAMFVGLTMGGMSGVLQYKIDLYQAWLNKQVLLKKYGLQAFRWDTPFERDLKSILNSLLKAGEQYARWGVVEFSYLSLARLSMGFMGLPILHARFLENIKSVFKLTLRSGVAQGFAQMGLFKDVEIQASYGAYSPLYLELYRDTFVFLISAMSVAISAVLMVVPTFGGEIGLWFFRYPKALLPLTAAGLGFYLHAFLAYLDSTSQRPGQRKTQESAKAY